MKNIRKNLQSIILNNKMNNDFLYDYIIVNEIKHTSNQNGIFINLSVIDDKTVNDMYEYTNKMTLNIKSRNKEMYIQKKPKHVNKIVYKPLPTFSKIQNQILEMSKTI